MSRLAVLLTRSGEDGTDLAAACLQSGLIPVVEPLLSARILEEAVLPDLGLYQGLVFTSTHGVWSFAKKTDRRDFAVYAVGSATAEAARAAGFQDVRQEGSRAEELAVLLERAYKITPMRLLYVRGRDISTDIKVKLAQKQINIDEIILYQADKAEKLTEKTVFAIKNGDIKAITFFSRRGGEAFCALVEQYGLSPYLPAMKALCISEAVLQSLSVLPFNEALVARTPDRYGMIKLLQDFSISKD